MAHQFPLLHIEMCIWSVCIMVSMAALIWWPLCWTIWQILAVVIVLLQRLYLFHCVTSGDCLIIEAVSIPLYGSW